MADNVEFIVAIASWCEWRVMWAEKRRWVKDEAMVMENAIS
jgi:hypothetical protein